MGKNHKKGFHTVLLLYFALKANDVVALIFSQVGIYIIFSLAMCLCVCVCVSLLHETLSVYHGKLDNRIQIRANSCGECATQHCFMVFHVVVHETYLPIQSGTQKMENQCRAILFMEICLRFFSVLFNNKFGCERRKSLYCIIVLSIPS